MPFDHQIKFSKGLACQTGRIVYGKGGESSPKIRVEVRGENLVTARNVL